MGWMEQLTARSRAVTVAGKEASIAISIEAVCVWCLNRPRSDRKYQADLLFTGRNWSLLHSGGVLKCLEQK